MGKILAILAILVWPLSAWAGVTYYVSNSNPAASDSNNGTSDSTPWLTINKVNTSTFNPGDQILFNKGCTWREQLIVPSSGSAGNPITFGSYGTGTNPVISGLGNNGAALSGFRVYSGNVWQIPLATQPYALIISTLPGAAALTPSPPVAGVSDVNAAGSWLWASNVLYVYSAGTPDGTILAPAISPLVELNAKSYITLNGLTISGGNAPAWNSGIIDGTRAASNYINITNCAVNQNCGCGISLAQSSYDVLDSNVITYNYGEGVQFYLNNGYTSTQNTFSNNLLHDNAGPAFYTCSDAAVDQLTYFSIYGNTSYNNSSGLYPGEMSYSNIYNNVLYGNTNKTGEVYGIGIACSNYNNVYNNIIHDNGNKGIDLYGDTTPRCGQSNGNQFYNNIIYNQSCCECTGITLGGMNGGLNNNLISYNILFNNFHNIAVGGPGGPPYNVNNEIVNNIMYGAGEYGLNVQSYNNPGITVENNIIAGSVGAELYAPNVSANFAVSNNIYYHPAAGPIVTYNNLDYTVETILSFDPQVITSNPLFMNGSGSYSQAPDFMLRSGSPAIWAGINVGLSTDYAGNAVNNPPSIGAYEYLAPILAPPAARLKNTN